MIHTRFALRRPVTTLMTFIALALIGVIAMRLLPLELFPDIRFPGIQVTIPYAGSTPEEVEQLITRPAEEAIATLSGIKEIRSTSSETGAELVVFFQWDRDPSAVGFEVRTKLESIRHEFPPSANRILTQMFAAGDDRVVAIRISSQEDLTRQYDTLDRYLKKPLERLDGVARVSLEGVEPLELRILVDPVRIAAHGIDIARLRDALEGANFSVSAGEITGGAQRFLVRPIGEFRTIDDVRKFIVTGNVRLHDVADVSLVTPELTVGRHLNGRPGVGLDVFKATGANIVDVAERVMAVVDEQRQLPQLQGIEVIVLQDQAENIRSSLTELRNAGLIGAGLALVVLFLFMRDWPTTLIVGLAVPFSLLITVAAMYFLGFSLNILTMMGMLLAIGLLVDNAVVVTESIFRHRQSSGVDPIASTLTGVTEVGLAVLAGTLSTVIVFLPIIFGEESEICDLHGARRRADRGRDAGIATRRADADPDADGALPPAPADTGRLVLRADPGLVPAPPRLAVRPQVVGGAVRGADGGLAGAAVRDRTRQDGHVPAGRLGPAVPAVPHRGNLPARAHRGGRHPRRTVS